VSKPKRRASSRNLTRRQNPTRAQRAEAEVIRDDPSLPPRLLIARREIEVGSLQGVRRALTFIADAMLRGRLNVAKSNSATYILSNVARVMETELLERRVEALEKLESEEHHGAGPAGSHGD
jgi:hypothetical protein